MGVEHDDLLSMIGSPERREIVRGIFDRFGWPEAEQLDEIDALVEEIGDASHLSVQVGTPRYGGRIWYMPGCDPTDLLTDLMDGEDVADWQDPILFDLESGEEWPYRYRRDSNGELILIPSDNIRRALPSSVAEAMNRR